MPVRKALCARDSYEAMVANHASSSADIERANEALQQPRQDDRARSSTIACRSRRRPLWQSLPPATAMTLTSEACTSLSYVCCWCVTPARNASSTLREASFTSHTARSLSLFSIVCSHCWCCPASYAEPCQQGGSSTRTHYLSIYVLCIFLFTHSSIFRERVVRNDSLIQRLGRQRSGAV